MVALEESLLFTKSVSALSHQPPFLKANLFLTQATPIRCCDCDLILEATIPLLDPPVCTRSSHFCGKVAIPTLRAAELRHYERLVSCVFFTLRTVRLRIPRAKGYS